MANSKADFYQAKLDELYAIIQRLNPSSPDADLEEFASCFAATCNINLKSMNLHSLPSVNREETIEDIKDVLLNYHIEDRQVVHFSLAPDGHTAFCQTVQRLNVMGDIIEPFHETQVVTFDDEGLVKAMNTYCCWSPIVAKIQKKTGMGPYAEGWEDPLAGAKMARMEKRARENGVSSMGSKVDVGSGCCT
ncbi:unnamed protein product [Periconia digitata]|uniref:SnoaL-like domain-containing protein n=1 Tax=Periconia digitata TaxID=1303443 RepID=A0A9W4UX09_9PLEO|nr:unnamed protein product [Periconia digitata]